MEVLVKYSQEYMGEILDDEYTTFAVDDDDISMIYEALYSDPHVFFVRVEKLGEEDE